MKKNKEYYMKLFRGMAGLSCLLLNTVSGAQAPLRRPVSAEQPFFIFGNGAGLDVFNALPEDLKPFSGINCNGMDNEARIQKLLEEAQAQNAPVILQIGVHNGDTKIPLAWFGEMFDRYPCLTGLSICEKSCANKPDTAFLAKVIELCAKKGGYFIWADMAFLTTGTEYPVPGPHVFVKAIRAMGGTFRKYKKNIILVDKMNGSGRYFLTRSLVVGAWLSDYCGNWGLNPEAFWWWNCGFTGLFAEPTEGWMIQPQKKSCMSMPDETVGQMMLNAASCGATVFMKFEPSTTIIMHDGRFTNGFNRVIAPLMSKMARKDYRLIPTREQVIEKTKIAYLITDDNAPELTGSPLDTLYKGLYGYDQDKRWELFPHTGRYFTIPVFAAPPQKELLKRFDIISSDDYGKKFRDLQEKISFFNAKYPEEYSGDAWAVRFGDRWFVDNPYENTDREVSFELPLKTYHSRSLAGTLSPHTFAIIDQSADGLSIFADNYRIDTNDIWNRNIYPYPFNPGPHFTDPPDKTLRKTEFVLRGLKGSGRPALKISGDNGYGYAEKTDKSSGEYRISIEHNGPVELLLSGETAGPDASKPVDILNTEPSVKNIIKESSIGIELPRDGKVNARITVPLRNPSKYPVNGVIEWQLNEKDWSISPKKKEFNIAAGGETSLDFSAGADNPQNTHSPMPYYVCSYEDPGTNKPQKNEGNIELGIVVRKTTKPPKIDGGLDGWAGFEPAFRLDRENQVVFKDLKDAKWSGPADLSADIYLAWDENFFYITARVLDDVFSQPNTGGETWAGDGIQICLDPLNEKAWGRKKSDYELGFALTPEGPQVWCWAGPVLDGGVRGGSAVKSIPFAAARKDGATNYEIAIPWKEIRNMSPDKGLGFNLIINDNDGQGRKGWIELAPGMSLPPNYEESGKFTIFDAKLVFK
jgi:hypothetical protein